MESFLKQINSEDLIAKFPNTSISLFTKRFNTVLIIKISSENELNVDDLIVLANRFKEILDTTNFRKFEFFLDLKNDNDKLKLLQEEIKLNYSYITSIEGSKLMIDFKGVLNSKQDSQYINEMAKNLKIKDYYNKVEFLNVTGNYSNINQFIERPTNYSYKSSESLFKNFATLKTSTLSITNLPRTKEELDNNIYPKVNISGEIFSKEVKPTKKSNLYIFKITNYIESAIIKCFSKDEINLDEGDSINVTGMIVYDDFMHQIVVNVPDASYIVKTNDEYIKEISLDGLFKENEEQRCELHVHSNYSTQDGLTSVEDYFKNAKNFGIKSLAIVDHENVQNFPDVEKAAKEYGVKPLYGVELNVINEDNYKIFYKGESASKQIIGLDIETTGFSAIYEEIIEIGAYKYVNGEKLEYSSLIKLDDFSILTDKITKLTGITKEMLEEEGKDAKEVLEGLIDFIGDGIIVGHNATFDVDFIEAKIEKYLGIKKNYSFIDTLNFSRHMLNDGKMKRFALDKVCKKLNVVLESHHRATDDAKACLDIYYKLMNKLETVSIDDESCPNFGMTSLSLKVNTNKLKESLLNFIASNDLEYTEENLQKEGSTRANSIFHFNLDIENTNKLLTFIKDTSIKIVEGYRRIKIYDNFEELNELITEEEIIANSPFIHMTVLIKNQKGLKELYKLISLSNIKRITPKGNAVLLKDILNNKDLKENILIGSSCVNGYFKQIYEKGFEHSKISLDTFDYVEIQPLEAYVSVSSSPNKREYIKDTVYKIIEKCKSQRKLLVASTDAHYIYPKFKEYRDVYVNTFGVGGVSHPLFGADETGLNVLYSTSSLLKTLRTDYPDVDSRTIRQMVMTNPDKVSLKVDDNIKVVPDKLYTPNDDFLKDKVLDVVGHKVLSIKKEFENIVYNEVKKYEILDGSGKLPSYISKRLKKEMDSIVGHGFYIIYYIAYLLVKKSNSDGYVVGSRGSVGSSFVANLLGVTEVNSLAPHYRCPKCHFQIYKGIPDIFNGIDTHYRKAVESVEDGFDLPKDVCPCCGKPLIRDGHDIPFETFLGFNGDKTPDIDLNFSGEYQPTAHNFCKTVFDERHAFRAGTLATVASKTAESYLKKYYISKNIKVSDVEISRRSKYLTDVKRTTGQHPGGIIVLPSNMDIYDFTPIQYPANKPQDWYTTHLDYNKIHENVLKMDILGHDDPTILKFLMDLVKENPSQYPFTNPKEIPIDDAEIMTFLRKDEKGVINSLGIPEFGTNFVRGMLDDINPQTFYDLVKTSGLSHGTDVWTTNSQDLVNGVTEFGKIPFRDTIACRDDIMVQLLYRGLKPIDAFSIMEFVRKGKVAKDPEKWNEYKKIMIGHNVPNWYIWSCEKIKYMFPKAHAVAYVLSALRIAWFKAHRPLDFYQAYFSVRADEFDSLTIKTNNAEIIRNRIDEINNNRNATAVEKKSITYLEVAEEMINRGFTFKEPLINLSHSTKFTKLNDKCLLMPFSSLNGVGATTANNVYENRKDKPYTDVKDLKTRGKADKKFVDALEKMDALNF